ncbi:MAG TPA: DUF4164 family protein [Hellea balneolensis]|uniref:DUF4164 family protein n=1 Tax=Hellea balneolensis TaxID=287478 RepID=A0A7C5R830_9PROT|nr:DUF4164 family protein [Hellea balneolensis]
MMNSSAIKDAAERLNRAVRSLEGSLEPLLAKVKESERAQDKLQEFESDRARLVSDLDDCKAKEAEFLKREQEFSRLARESQAELDEVISQVMDALGGGD